MDPAHIVFLVVGYGMGFCSALVVWWWVEG